MGHFSVIGYYWMLLSLCFLYLHKPTYFISSYPICLGIFVVLRQGSLPKNQENNDQFSKTLKIRTIRTTIFSVFMTLKQKSAKMHVIFELWWCYMWVKCTHVLHHDWKTIAIKICDEWWNIGKYRTFRQNIGTYMTYRTI